MERMNKMIKFENLEVCGWEPAIRGMRNPMNSWDKSDSLFYTPEGDYCNINGNIGPCDVNVDVEIGPNDHDLMMRLNKGGTEHSKYRRMITVYVDITAPLYWWKEFDTYKVGTVANSCSTMHKIHAKEFTRDDFSCEHLENDFDAFCYEPISEEFISPVDVLDITITILNYYRNGYLRSKNKNDWWQMIQLLPSSYNQKRTVMLNYENLAAMYRQRKDHKLDEWHDFCNWIKQLPYSELITLEEVSE